MRTFAVATVLACALGVAVSGSVPPEQIHIALAGRDSAGNPDRMAVSWVTQEATATSVVRYGRESGELTEVAMGSSKSYLKTFDHHAVLDKLQLGTQYYYQVGDADGGWSEEYKFETAPASSNASVAFAVVGDFGVVNADDTMERMRNGLNDYDLVFHVGDISYADDWFIHGILQFFSFGYEVRARPRAPAGRC